MLEQGLMPFREKGFSHVTVNSSAYAVPVYQHLGFVVMRPEQCVSGIRFTPMTLHLA